MTPLILRPLVPATLNSRQRENYHFQKLSGVLADFGYQTVRLTDDWNGADFIAQHIDGIDIKLVQLKGRLTFDKKYIGKSLWIAFPDLPDWFLFPHDDLLDQALQITNIGATESWERGNYSFPSIPESLRPALGPYRLPVA